MTCYTLNVRLTRSHTGFTLIELLLVIGIIAILASIVIVAINPTKQLRQAFGRQRSHNVNELRKAMYQYTIDNGITAGDRTISTDPNARTNICRMGQTDGSCVNIDEIAPIYISCIPYDTMETNTALSGFSIYDSNGFLTVVADYDIPTATGGVECLAPPQPLSAFAFNQALAATINDTNGTYTAAANNMAPPSGLVANGPSGISTTSWQFDGSDDTVSISYTNEFDLVNELTLAAWVYPTSFSAADNVNAIVRKGEANPNMWQLAIEDGYLTMMLESSDGVGGRVQSSSQLTLNTWQHVVGTWDGTTATIYVDGTVVDSNPYTGSNAGLLATDSRDVYIGGRTGSDYFNGNLYDVRIYNTTVTTTQIGKIINGKM